MHFTVMSSAVQKSSINISSLGLCTPAQYRFSFLIMSGVFTLPSGGSGCVVCRVIYYDAGLQ